jgi:hypothetical protein
VKRGPYYVADCATVAELAKLVDLATLMPNSSEGRGIQAGTQVEQ